MPRGSKIPERPPFPDSPFPQVSDSRNIFFKIGFIERSHRKIFASVFSQYGLHPSQGFALSMIVHRPGRAQRELADDMRIERATVTVTLQKLERGGFIRRELDPDDQRVMRIYPTEKGIEVETNITDEMERFHAACAEILTTEQRSQLIDLLQHIENSVIDYQQRLNRQKESSQI